jgi:hypothetical protein
MSHCQQPRLAEEKNELESAHPHEVLISELIKASALETLSFSSVIAAYQPTHVNGRAAHFSRDAVI